MSAYNNRAEYFERNFIMTIVRYALRTLRSISVFALLASLCVPQGLAQAPAPVKYDSGTISGLTARNIGSATMGGRIAAASPIHQGRGTRILISLSKDRATPEMFL